METLVFFSNKGIEVVKGVKGKGRLNIEASYNFPMEEGAMLNGVITDVEMVESVLKEAAQTHKNLFQNVKLIIDSSLIAIKNIEIPTLKKKDMEKLVATEFEDSAGNYEDLVADYTMIPGPTKENMLCIGLEKGVLETYVNLFKGLKIKIKSIDVGLNAIIQYITQTKDYKGMTLAINVVDGKNLVSLLFNEGKYIFSNRSRLLADRGTESFAMELSDKLSTLIQFHKSQKMESELNMSIYAGLDELELDMLRSSVYDPEMNLFMVPQTPNIAVKSQAQDDFSFSEDFLIATGFFSHKKQVNLYTAYLKHLKPKKEMKPWHKALILPAGMIALFLGVFLALFLLGHNMEDNLVWINEYIADAENQQQFMEAQALSDQLDLINARISDLESLNGAIASKPSIVAAKLNELESLQNNAIELTSMSYSEEDGILHLSGYANSEKDASRYVDRIKATEYFTYINYTGYALREMERTITTSATATSTSTSTTSTVTVFDFSVDCYLKAGE
ncbi:pilus assembly protein PilM [Eubacteriaceae bacterium ES3]|nr:pilus assembly protein PilM [Eubacteriaceae bacterium ES3]